ncbi:GGDEF domain-containing protein [Gordonia sp. i37]|nr:GGDEF domain-containing protein [Gordonia sp. i37]
MSSSLSARSLRRRGKVENGLDGDLRERQVSTSARSAIFLAGGRDRVAQWGIAALTLCFGIVAALCATTPDGTRGSVVRTTVVLALAVSTIPVAIVMTRMRIYTSWWSRAVGSHSLTSLNNVFVLYADVGLVVGLFAARNPLLTVQGCVLFAVIGGFVAHFVRLGVMYAHMAFSSLAIMSFAVIAGIEGAPAGTVAYSAFVTFVASNGIVLLLRSYSAAFKQALRTQLNWANTDPLTGVLNRRGFDSAATGFLQSGRPVTLIMIDVDRFKQINDAHGHSVGDAILSRLATRIADIAGPGAATGRLGGDEFAVVMRASGDEALAAIEQIRETPPGILGETPVTVSIGAVFYTGADQSAEPAHTIPSLAEAMSIADDALLAAKEAGRNTHIVVDADMYDVSVKPGPFRNGGCTSRPTMRTRMRPRPAERIAANGDVETLV